MGQQNVDTSSPEVLVSDARGELGDALNRVDAARMSVAAGRPADLGAVISCLERAESKLDELQEALNP